ncbi:MAG TPA: YciI family protein [Caulobacteraceae bacterium]|nr:YciI family protein [Caulobacteraceae bacterium]
MRFMITRKADADTEARKAPSHELAAAMMAYNEEMAKAGVLLGGDGLRPTADGFRVKFEGGKPTVIDGPFTEAKELVAGYTLIQVNSREEALEWARRWPAEDADGQAYLEVRQLYEVEDFGEEVFTPDLVETYERHRVRTA